MKTAAIRSCGAKHEQQSQYADYYGLGVRYCAPSVLHFIAFHLTYIVSVFSNLSLCVGQNKPATCATINTIVVLLVFICVLTGII